MVSKLSEKDHSFFVTHFRRVAPPKTEADTCSASLGALPQPVSLRFHHQKWEEINKERTPLFLAKKSRAPGECPFLGIFAKSSRKWKKLHFFAFSAGRFAKFPKRFLTVLKNIFFFQKKNSGVGKYFFKKNFQTDFFVGVPMCLWVNYTSNFYAVWMDWSWLDRAEAEGGRLSQAVCASSRILALPPLALLQRTFLSLHWPRPHRGFRAETPKWNGFCY